MRLKILCVIPARGGSKGIPNKNLRILGDRPLIAHVIGTALKCKLIDHIVVSTDNEAILDTAKEFGAETPFVRPSCIAQDSTPLNPVVSHAIQHYESTGFFADAVISLQPTNPFTSEATITKALEKFQETGCDSVVTVAEIKHGHPYRAKKITEGARLENFCTEFDGDMFLNRQERPAAYTYTGALYLRGSQLIKSWSGRDMGLGNDCRGLLVGWKEAINIDDELDFRLAELVLKENL